MRILDAIKTLKENFGQHKKELTEEKDAHLITMTERDVAREALQPTLDALQAAQSELAAIATELEVEYPMVEKEAEEEA